MGFGVPLPVASRTISSVISMSILHEQLHICGDLVIVLPEDELWWFRAVPDQKVKTSSPLNHPLKVGLPDHTGEVHGDPLLNVNVWSSQNFGHLIVASW